MEKHHEDTCVGCHHVNVDGGVGDDDVGNGCGHGLPGGRGAVGDGVSLLLG